MHNHLSLKLICMQLCKCINCFLKAHNKQLNQYCFNFTIFFTKKKSFKKMVRVRVGLTRKKHGSGHGSTRFCFRSKNRVQVVFFRVGSGRVRKFWPVLPCLIIWHLNYAGRKLIISIWLFSNPSFKNSTSKKKSFKNLLMCIFSSLFHHYVIDNY